VIVVEAWWMISEGCLGEMTAGEKRKIEKCNVHEVGDCIWEKKDNDGYGYGYGFLEVRMYIMCIAWRWDCLEWAVLEVFIGKLLYSWHASFNSTEHKTCI
jgi:hypothetical protein